VAAWDTNSQKNHKKKTIKRRIFKIKKNSKIITKNPILCQKGILFEKIVHSGTPKIIFLSGLLQFIFYSLPPGWRRGNGGFIHP